MNERWLPIPGYEGRYEVSNLGRVKSLRRIIVLRRQTNIRKEKILNGWVDAHGYKKVGLYNEALKMQMHLVHRLALLAFVGPSKLIVNHKDLNKLNNFVENLEYVSFKENTIHAIKWLGVWQPKNEAHVNCKISFDEMVEILFMRLLKTPTKNISLGYGIREDYVKGLRYRADYQRAFAVAKRMLLS